MQKTIFNKLRNIKRFSTEMETKRPKDPKHDDNLDDMNITKKVKFPKKGDYRMRAHINPLGDTPFPQ